MIAQTLPNGFCVLVLSPREAVNLCDQILEPSDFPWQHTEAQVVALEAKSRLAALVNEQASKDLRRAGRELAKASTGEVPDGDDDVDV